MGLFIQFKTKKVDVTISNAKFYFIPVFTARSPLPPPKHLSLFSYMSFGVSLCKYEYVFVFPPALLQKKTQHLLFCPPAFLSDLSILIPRKLLFF